MPRFATKPGAKLGRRGRSLRAAAATVCMMLASVYMLQYVQMDLHQMKQQQVPNGRILSGAVMAGGLSAAEQATIAAKSSVDVFAGPTLDLSQLPTLLTLLTDYPQENTWPAVPLETVEGAGGNATANATAGT